MPPHCDAMDGPVVKAAIRALDAGDAGLVLPYVHESGEKEVGESFDRAMRARALGPDARELADRYFFETVVRVHRAGEGAPYTGVKPAGLPQGPAIPLAEQAVESGSAEGVYAFLSRELKEELDSRLGNVTALAAHTDDSVPAAREYVEAMLDFEVFAHRVHTAMHAGSHGDGTTGRQG
ncbi:DUF6448 family protein [Streptosporangium canum]|uniref:DUF6448 family protein n=1 Tax=Streptosporangium canum TaxID=324952 RepID=UPI0037B1EDDA